MLFGRLWCFLAKSVSLQLLIWILLTPISNLIASVEQTSFQADFCQYYFLTLSFRFKITTRLFCPHIFSFLLETFYSLRVTFSQVYPLFHLLFKAYFPSLRFRLSRLFVHLRGLLLIFNWTAYFEMCLSKANQLFVATGHSVVPSFLLRLCDLTHTS